MYQLAILVSGNGSLLQVILDAINNQEVTCQINQVIADRECIALEKARAAGLPTLLLPRKHYPANLSEVIAQHLNPATNLIVLAGFLSILSPALIRQWSNKIINSHPSLLPNYGGRGMWGNKVHQAVLANREKCTGCSIHYVTPEVDGGSILAQTQVAVHDSDTVFSLQQRVQAAEAKLLVQLLQQLISAHQLYRETCYTKPILKELL
jgi:phosphoribosylglycinamide formyltransferase-1